MSSCYSGTKIFPASTLPCKKGTVKTGDRISHNKTSNSQGPPRLSGILQPDVSGSQAWKQMETSDRFVKSKHFHKVSKVYHGDTRTNQIGNTSQRLGHIPRFVGRIPTCPDSSELSEISEICLPGTGVGVQSSAIWALSSPMVVHTHSTGGESSSTEKRHINAHLSRRLAIKVPVETHIDQANAVDPKNVSVFGTADKYGQVRIEPLSGFRVPGLQVSNSVTQSAAITQESPSHLRNGSSFYPKRPKHSKVLDVSVRAPQCYRKTSSYGQTTPSQYTTLSKRSMECEIAQPALSSTIKSVGFDRSAVVDDVQTCTSFLPHSSITANPSSLHGRLSGRVGCSLQRESCFGHMGTTVGTQTHKSPGAPGYCPGHDTLGAGVCKPGCVGCHRQHDCGSIHQQTGRHIIQNTLSAHCATPQLVSPQTNNIESSSHSRQSQYYCRWSIPTGTDSANRVGSESTNIQGYLSDHIHSPGGFICHKVQSQVGKLCIPSTRQPSLGHRCPVNVLERDVGLCLPPNTNYLTGPEQNIFGPVQDLANSSSIPKNILVPGSVEIVNHGTHKATSKLEFVETAKNKQVPHEPRESQSARLALVRKSIRDKGFSEKATLRISEPVRPSTAGVYDSKWRVFSTWCSGKQIDSVNPSIQQVADFLVEKSEGGTAASTLSGYRTAISNTLKHSSGLDISSSEEISSLIRSFFLRQPRVRNPIPSWNLSLVLKMLRQPPFEPLTSVPIKFLTFKVVFLLTLASGKRRSEIHAIERNSISWPEDKSQITLRVIPEFIAKTQLSADVGSLQPIVVKSLSQFLSEGMIEDLKLCPVRAIFCYLDRTKKEGLVKHKRLLFVSHKPGICRDITRSTISSWLKQTICLAYKSSSQTDWDAHKVKAHQVRAFAASTAFYNKAPLGEVLQACTWASHNTFTSFYLQNLSEQMGDRLRLAPFIAGQSAIIPRDRK